MIRDILKEQRIRISLKGNTKEEVMEEMVDLICKDFKENTESLKEKILKSTLDREKRMSTGIGKGVALPRYQGNGVEGIIASFGIKPEGIDFQALDSNPVQFIFFLAAGEKEEEGYTEALSRMARILNQEGIQDRMLHVKNSEEIFSLLKKEEAELWK
jgi:PTS system fructose-specific IIC component